MKREEALRIIKECKEKGFKHTFYTLNEYHTALDIAIKALEQEPYDFAKWVATEIFDENWEYNKDAFAEIACRKLAKLGIVRAKGDEWELIDPQERSDKE